MLDRWPWPWLCLTSVSDRSWVLLRNTHLCPEWLGGLEKKLRGLSLHPSFRLFLTSEVCMRHDDVAGTPWCSFVSYSTVPFLGRAIIYRRCAVAKAGAFFLYTLGKRITAPVRSYSAVLC